MWSLALKNLARLCILRKKKIYGNIKSLFSIKPWLPFIRLFVSLQKSNLLIAFYVPWYEWKVFFALPLMLQCAWYGRVVWAEVVLHISLWQQHLNSGDSFPVINTQPCSVKKLQLNAIHFSKGSFINDVKLD